MKAESPTPTKDIGPYLAIREDLIVAMGAGTPCSFWYAAAYG
jgi:hypothetical protein